MCIDEQQLKIPFAMIKSATHLLVGIDKIFKKFQDADFQTTKFSIDIRKGVDYG